MTISTKGIRTPNDGDDWDLTLDLAAMAVTIDDMLSQRYERTATTVAGLGTGLYLGQPAWVSGSTAPGIYFWNGTTWVLGAGGFGVDAAGWTWVTLSSGKRMFYREFVAWAAPNDFGGAGGSFWNQTRSTLAAPTGTNFSNLLPFISVYPTTAANANQVVIQGGLSASSGTSVNLNFYNPSALAVSRSNMDLKCSVKLIEK